MTRTYFWYYEDGKPKRFGMRKAYRMFQTMVSSEQKNQGTTFDSWLHEMMQMQIFCT